MGKLSDVDAFILGGVLTLGLTIVVGVLPTHYLTAKGWEKEAIAHGAATYVEENGKTIFKWKDQTDD